MREEGRFRDDLYFRLAALPLKILPLRDRPEDIVPLADAILLSLGVARGTPVQLAPDAREAMAAYRWPGNAREMRNVLERGVLLSDSNRIELRHLGLDGSASPRTPAKFSSDFTLAEVERRHVLQLIDEENGHVEAAARRLGIPRSSLYQKQREYGLEAATFQKSRRS